MFYQPNYLASHYKAVKKENIQVKVMMSWNIQSLNIDPAGRQGRSILGGHEGKQVMVIMGQELGYKLPLSVLLGRVIKVKVTMG